MISQHLKCAPSRLYFILNMMDGLKGKTFRPEVFEAKPPSKSDDQHNVCIVSSIRILKT